MPTARFWDLRLKDGAITVARSRFDAAYRVLLTKAEKRAYLTRPCFPVAGACAEVLAGDHAGSVGITGVPEGPAGAYGRIPTARMLTLLITLADGSTIERTGGGMVGRSQALSFARAVNQAASA